MTTTSRLMPRLSSGIPYVSRIEPDTVSMPMDAHAKPSPIETIVFIGEPPPKATKLPNASRKTVKYSTGENLRAKRVAHEERIVTVATPSRAPKPDDRKAVVSASVARPALAIGWPSKVVATDDGSPGMLKRIEVVDPP